MTIGVFGMGRFGSFWASLLSSRFTVIGYDANPDRVFPEGVKRASLGELCVCPVIFLCVTIRAVPEVLKLLSPRLSPGTIIADTCSVKLSPMRWMLDILPSGVDILATHPMFGPESAKEGIQGLAMMMDPVRLSAENERFWETTFRGMGLSVVRMSCDQHDREAAYSQALTHFVGRSLFRMGLLETSIATRWYSKLQAVARQCVRDAPELFEDMQRFNPYAAPMRQAVLDAFSATLAEIGPEATIALDEAAISPVESKRSTSNEQ